MAVVAPAAEEGRPVLSVENVDVRIGGIQALKGVSLNVRMGEICGLIGPNGAGKTTLFNCVTRLSTVTAGTIRLHGQTIETLPPRRADAVANRHHDDQRHRPEDDADQRHERAQLVRPDLFEARSD